MGNQPWSQFQNGIGERSIKSGQKDTEASIQAFSVTDSTDRSDSKVAFFIDFDYPKGGFPVMAETTRKLAASTR